MPTTQVETKFSKSSLRKKLFAGVTATVMALGALVGFAGPASAAPVFATPDATASATAGTTAVVFTANATDAIAYFLGYTSRTPAVDGYAGEGFTINSATGAVTMASTVEEGEYVFYIEADDGDTVATQSLTITVSAAPASNSAPEFTSGATGTGIAGTASTVYTAVATDADSDTITYSLTEAVTGFTIDAATGVVTMADTVVADEYELSIGATDGEDSATPLTVTITVTDPVAPEIATATITGTPTVGQVLTAGSTGVTGTPTPTLSYQWKADGTNIVDATSSTFTLTSAQLGAVITVEVTVTNTQGSDSALSSGTTAVAAAPVVSTPTPSAGGGTVVAPPVQAPAPTPVVAPVRKPTGAFAANSSKLTKELRVSIRKALAANPNAKAAICRGFVASGTASAADRKLARDRSTAVCNLITKLNPDLDVEVKKVVVASSSKQLRKVRMVLR